MSYSGYESLLSEGLRAPDDVSEVSDSAGRVAHVSWRRSRLAHREVRYGLNYR